MNTFWISNKWQYRLLRTVAQALCGWCVDNIAMLIAQTDFSADLQIIIVGLVMTILSPVMKKLGVEDEKHRDETYNRPVPEGDEEDANDKTETNIF